MKVSTANASKLEITVTTPYTNENIAKEEVALIKTDGEMWGVEVRWTGHDGKVDSFANGEVIVGMDGDDLPLLFRTFEDGDVSIEQMEAIIAAMKTIKPTRPSDEVVAAATTREAK